MSDLGWNAFHTACEKAAEDACMLHRAKFGLTTPIEEDQMDCDDAVCRKGCPFCASESAKKGNEEG